MRASATLAVTFVSLLVGACPPPEDPPGANEPPPVPTIDCPGSLTPVDTSGATVVGDGTPGSCTEAALDAALAAHQGQVRFDCGPDPVTVVLTSEKVIAADLVLDGGGRVTLDGNDDARILRIDSSFELSTPRVVVQGLTFTRGRASGTDLSGGGAAITRTGGTLDVIECHFADNHGNEDGQDTAGGAIFSLGGGFTTISSSTFSSNTASNGGALGNLGNDLVVTNSVFDGNAATGTGGNPGNGGNGGTISIDGEGREVTLCGVVISDSTANAFGGGIFRVAYQGTEPTNLHATVVDNALIPDREPSLGGGLYLQGTTVTMTSSTLLNNSARAAGAAFFGPGATIHLLNVSVLDNTAASSLGGGLFLSGLAGGDIVHSTFAGNRAPGELAFGGAIVGDGGNVTLLDSLILDSEAGNGFNPVSCTTQLQDGSGSFQFPVARSGGGSDDPDALCAPGITVLDVDLDDLDRAGTVPVRAPKAGAPARGAATDCPDVDTLGAARGEPCTSGAVE